MTKNYNLDIMEWSKFPEYDIIWTDPPWGNPMVKWFQTLMFKKTKKRVDYTINDILGKLGELSNPSKPLIVEYDQRQKLIDEAISILTKYGHKHIKTIQAKQSTSAEFSIIVFNKDINIADPKITTGFTLLTESIREYRGTGGCIVFDPFAGMGNTAKAVINAGATYIGSEINYERYLKLCKANP
jgi:DNA modification methylase